MVGAKRTYYSTKFAIDFVGGELGNLPKDARVEPVITASRGTVEAVAVRPLAQVKGYRVVFDLKPTDEDVTPFELRVHLKRDGRALTESWLYQWTPPPVSQRKF